MLYRCCDLLENSYLCGISNNILINQHLLTQLWFAWKFVPLWYQQQLPLQSSQIVSVVICLKIRTFVVSATTIPADCIADLCCDLLENSYLCGISNNHTSGLHSWFMLWFAWKFVPLWYQQQLGVWYFFHTHSCDLLENSYLCGISNNDASLKEREDWVVICLKIRTFVVSATTYQWGSQSGQRCDLLENSYLCGISNNK